MIATAALAPISPDATDAELARRVASGEEAAVRLLTKRHNQTLFRTARAILRDDAEAEDAVQDAYIKAIRGIGGFRNDSRLRTWLVRIAVTESLQRLRGRRRTAEIVTLTADSPAHEEEVRQMADVLSPSPEGQAMQGEARRMMEARIDALPEAFRTVFVLRAVEELSVEETAEALGIPESTVRTRFFRARSMLRESLARDMDVALGEAFQFAGERCERITARVLARLQEPPAGG